MRKKGLVWGDLVKALIALILIAVLVYWIWNINYTIDQSNNCEKNGGTCLSVCHQASGQYPMSYSCDKKEELCCFNPDQPGAGENTGSVGTTLIPGNKLYLYDNAEFQGDPITTTGEQYSELKVSNEPYTFYFGAEGENVGVCVASIMYWDPVTNAKKLLSGNRQYYDCSSTLQPLSFLAINDYVDTSKYKEFYLEVIVFDKDYGLGESFEQSNAWKDRDKWVAAYSKTFTVTPNCGMIETKDDCTAQSSSCVWCNLNDKCLDHTKYADIAQNGGRPAAGACLNECREVSGTEITGSRLTSDGKECVTDAWVDTCDIIEYKPYIMKKYDSTNAQLKFICSNTQLNGDHFCGCKDIAVTYTNGHCTKNLAYADEQETFLLRGNDFTLSIPYEKVYTYNPPSHNELRYNKVCIKASYTPYKSTATENYYDEMLLNKDSIEGYYYPNG